MYTFTPAVLVCVVNNEGDPVAGHLQKLIEGKGMIKIEKTKH